MKTFKIWALSLVTVIVLGIMGYAIYTVRAYVPYIGFLALVAIGVGIVLALAAGIIFVLKMFYQAETIEIGNNGTYLRRFNVVQPLAPLTAVQPKQIAQKTNVQPVIPTLAEILKQGVLGTADLLLGYHPNGTPLWGLWSDVRTFCIAGKGRSGKTITMLFFILQAILNGAVIYICDPHFNKPSSITSLLKPLGKWLVFAGSDDAIMQSVEQFLAEMERRLSGASTDDRPYLLVIDEFTRLVTRRSKEEGELIVGAVIACAEEYAGFNGYAMIAGHEWTAQGQVKELFVKLRRALHAVFVHRLDMDYAKYLLNKKRYADNAPSLKTGYNFFQDTEGQIHELVTPLGTHADVLTVANMLAELTGSTPMEIPSHTSYKATDIPTYQPVERFHQVPLETYDVRLLDRVSSERESSVKPVHKPVNPGESLTIPGETGDTSTSPATDAVRILASHETAILHAAYEISKMGGTVTRSGIRDRLQWTNKQWSVIKAVCDKYHIA